MLFLLRGSAQNQTVKPFDILITEFMADPMPTRGLPNSEYIELYNRTNRSIRLGGFKIVNGNVHSTALPDTILKSKSFIIVYAKKSAVNFSPYGDTLQFTKLPTLSNPKDIFYLKSPDDSVIDAASYDVSYYQNPYKAQGGYSLERINVNAFCSANNWIASNDSSGGTSGKKNSVYRDTIDKIVPELILAYPDGNKGIIVNFDKSMDRILTTDINHYSINNNLRISDVKILDTSCHRR